jgi:transposase
MVAMDVIHRRCAGLDVHQAFVVVCRRILDDDGRLTKETREYSTMTHDLLRLGDWLTEAGITHLAMESSGVYWKPIWNLLEDRFTILLVNARHVKQVPGRKTDVLDADWLAQLLQHGLLRPSFVPPTPIRDLRDLTRHRTSLLQERTRGVNRIHKVLEDANIKLSAVASDIMGVSGRAMLRALMAGDTDAVQMADLARRRLRRKREGLAAALTGRVRPHHRYLLQTLLTHVDFVSGQIADLDARIDEQLRPFAAELALIRTIPGLKRRASECVLAEVGPTMTIFPSAAHLCSWAAVCPGQDETGGKRRSGRTRHGNRWLRGALTEAAWAAARTKHSYFAGQYRRLAGRRGKKRALVAVSHSLLIAVYHVLKAQVPHQDLGTAHFDRLAPTQLTRYLVKRLERLGHKVTLEPTGVAA